MIYFLLLGNRPPFTLRLCTQAKNIKQITKLGKLYNLKIY